tara:strand:- start:195 stop:332 length:138 start_codon:yes stop_codon:yes gene_type:complete
MLEEESLVGATPELVGTVNWAGLAVGAIAAVVAIGAFNILTKKRN